MKKISQMIYSEFIKSTFFILLLLSFIFSRSFLGVYIFGFRIGEYLMAFALVLFIFTLFYKFENNPLNLLNSNVKLGLTFLFLLFVLTFVNSNSQLFDPYSYKTSTYIWSISFLFLGMSSKEIKLDKLRIKILQLLIIFVYVTSIYGYPEGLIDLILQISDKYELHKGSDLALFYIICIVLINRSFNYTFEGFKYLCINSSLFLPLLLFKSRSAFIACFILFIFEFYKCLKDLNFLKKQTLILFATSICLLTISTYLTQNKVIPEEINIDLISDSYSSLSEYRLKHYQQDYPLFYYEDGRVFSGDGNLNWRLIMWQDAIDDNIGENKLLVGVGYKEMFNIFQVDNTGYGNDRRGIDKLNEQVHNYFLTVLLRGGLFQLIILLFIFYNILNTKPINGSKASLGVFMFAVFFISSFDSSMENSHFPLLFYYFLGNFYLVKERT
tara:strand:+ start:2777 stop:4099 length:1323 start_codon:yes stop_codon:yes gene_type:complete